MNARQAAIVPSGHAIIPSGHLVVPVERTEASLTRTELQAEINAYEKHIKIVHCAAASILVIITCVASMPIIFAVPKMDVYGHYIVFITIALYTLCSCLIIIKWRFSIIDNRKIIAKKMKLMESINPLCIV